MKHLFLAVVLTAACTQVITAQNANIPTATEPAAKPGKDNVAFQNELTLNITPITLGLMGANFYDIGYELSWKKAVKTGFFVLEAAHFGSRKYKPEVYSLPPHEDVRFVEANDSALIFAGNYRYNRSTTISMGYEYRVPWKGPFSYFFSGGPLLGYSERVLTDYEKVTHLDSNFHMTNVPAETFNTLLHVKRNMLTAGVIAHFGARVDLSSRVSIVAEFAARFMFHYTFQSSASDFQSLPAEGFEEVNFDGRLLNLHVVYKL